MHIIKLNAIDSTNAYLKALASKNKLEDYTIVVANHQTHGRGQMGTSWHVEAGKNLTCSVFLRIKLHSIDDSFYISMITSLAIIRALQEFGIPKLHVKWPNDILSEEKKICGILIENIIKNTSVEGSVIGFGLNVNQMTFDNLPQAASLKRIMGRSFNLDEILLRIVFHLNVLFSEYENRKLKSIKTDYETLLFRKDKPSTFKTNSGKTFPGFIKGVDSRGRLNVLVEDNIMRTFDLKEIQLLY